mmetsp:Transcript_13386/g.23033  ORF Transcript_13386/g.23033 Transcript_13386/m.23033 type:complete len:234 (+) Transcript_13386:339-1040(+)
MLPEVPWPELASILANSESGRAASSLGLSNSATSPWLRTRTRLLSMMVLRRWAMATTVASRNSSRITRCTIASVSMSTEEVASSRTRIRALRSSTRARHTSCFWPEERFVPPSETGISRPSGAVSTSLLKLTLSSTLYRSSSECSLNGSRLLRMVPEKRTGSCGMMDNFDRRSRRPMRPVSMPSMTMEPLAGSTNRNRDCTSVDFPAPVRPTTPTFSPPLKEQLMPLRTRSAR